MCCIPFRDKLTGSLIGLARATEGNEHMIGASTAETVVAGLLATREDVDYDCDARTAILKRVADEKQKLVPDCALCACPCGRTDDYDMDRLWNSDAKIRDLKLQILSGIRDIAASGYRDETVHNLLYKALIVLGIDDWSAEALLPIAQEVDAKCREIRRQF